MLLFDVMRVECRITFLADGLFSIKRTRWALLKLGGETGDSVNNFMLLLK